ncbi:MAG: ChbG/HpnK family deacetylase, partial [Spirochaetaceae bacterium]|nr:ChbG/HpnK family deacetylase [Spirochaetaceae bacterium]
MTLDSDPTGSRFLIVTADDFGASDWIDRGIFQALETGQISTVSALTNYPRAADAIGRLRQDYPDVGIGIHLNITSGPALISTNNLGILGDEDGNFLGLRSLLVQIDRLDMVTVTQELHSQIEVVLNQGIEPDHLSSHHNILAYNPALQNVMISLAKEFNLPVRTPVAVSQTHGRRFGYARTRRRAIRSVVRLLVQRPLLAFWVLPGYYLRLRQSKHFLDVNNVRHPDHMIDALYGMPTVRNLEHILEHLPIGISELVMHLADDV